MAGTRPTRAAKPIPGAIRAIEGYAQPKKEGKQSRLGMTEMIQTGFEDRCTVPSGMLLPELTYLVGTGFFKPRRLVLTLPGLHTLPEKLEKYLLRRLA